MEKLYLVHHGIAGQKWGVENGPPYPLTPQQHSAKEKRLAAKTLNNADKELSMKERRAKESVGNVNRLQNKYDKIRDKKSTKATNLKAKLKESKLKADKDVNEFKKGEKDVKKLVQDYLKQGYTIESKRVTRDVRTGKEKAAGALIQIGTMTLGMAAAYYALGAAGIPGGSAVAIGINPIQKSVNGVKYRVK